jgi:hypothetical protein
MLVEVRRQRDYALLLSVSGLSSLIHLSKPHCAVFGENSSQEGTGPFDAQREGCQALIASQRQKHRSSEIFSLFCP